MTNHAAAIAALSPEQRQRLAAQLTPLSYAQEQLWLLHQLAPDDHTYNVQYVLRARGTLDLERLRRAAQAVARRHAVLRTSLLDIDGATRQIIHAQADPDWAVEDLRALAPPDREPRARDLVAQLLRQPFDLTQPPLLRLRVYPLDPDHHLLAVVAHHVVLDAASVQLFMVEMALAYHHDTSADMAGGCGGTAGGNNSATGQPLDPLDPLPPLPPLALQYADYAAWQRQAAARGEFDADLAYWRERLHDLPQGLDLPTDHSRSQAGRAGGGRVVRVLSAARAQGLNALCQREQVTRFMALLSAWAALLGRYTHQDDLLVGVPVSGRTRAEVRPLIGNFVNSVVMRLDLRGALGYRDLLAQAREVVTGAFSHQGAPLQRVLEEIRSAGDPQRKQLFQVLMNMVGPAGTEAARLPGVEMTPVTGIDPPGAMFELGLVVHDLPGEITCHIDYDAALFDRPTVERLADHFDALLAAALADPARPLRSLPMLGADEQAWLLANGRGQRQEVPGLTVHELFMAQARRTPEAVAVYDRGTVLSYRQLDRRSNALAVVLRRQGLAPEGFAFTLLEEGLDVVVTWLAVLKAGGAFIPLDIAAPAHRNQHLLDAHPSFPLLGGKAWRDGWNVAPDRWVEVVGHTAETDEQVPARVLPGHPIYAMFTSGSTGVPKGVVVTHWGIMNRLAWMENFFEPGAAARALKTTRHTFDSAIWQIFWPLSNGGRTVIIDANMPDGVRANFELIRDQGITAVDFVPSAFSAMREELDACAPAFDHLPALKLVIFGGEQVTRDGVDWFHQHADAPVFNLYGPTEASIGCIHHRLDRGFKGGIPIGRAIANTDILLLSPDLAPVPVGVAGEICLAGACLARGYLQQPATTARSFIPSPFHDGGRLYRTGDLGRWRADGTLEFLGRIDHQVKIRGFRIELGEVETALLAHPAVGQAAVIAHQGEGGIKRLVAYVVARTETGPDLSALRAHLRDRLPDYMQPAKILALPALPMLPNGKLDRRALPEPFVQGTAPDPAASDHAPASDMERDIAAVVGEVLGLASPGRQDNYFDLGGDSIQSIRIVARARQRGILLTAAQIFAHQTIDRIALVAQRLAVDTTGQGEVTGRVVLTPIQRRFLGGDRPPSLLCHTLVLASDQPLSQAALANALLALERHHDALRLRFERGEQGWTATTSAPAHTVDCQAHDLGQMSLDEGRAELRRQVERLRASLDVSRGPLLRAALFRLGDGSQRLALVAHHLVVDVVSWNILLEDLRRLLRAGEGTDPATVLPPKTTSFQTWADRLERLASEPALQAEAAWWAGRPWSRAGRLPESGAAAADVVHAADPRGTSRFLEPGATQALTAGAWTAHGLQVGELLLATLAQSLAAVEGSRWQAISVEGHGREEQPGLDVSRTVGWFTSLYPVLLEIPSHPVEAAGLADLRVQLRAIPQRGFGFGILRYMAASPGVAAVIQPQVLLNYAGQIDRGLADATGFALTDDNSGWASSTGPRERHPIQLNASIRDGRLGLHWNWEAGRIDDAVVATLAEAVLVRLTRLAEALVVSGHAASGARTETTRVAGAGDVDDAADFQLLVID